METIFSSSGQYNTSMETCEPREEEKDFWEKCMWYIKHRPLMFLLILVLALTIIGALIFFTTDIFTEPQAIKYKPLELQKLLNGSYEPNHFNGTWISDDEILMKNVHGDIVLYNVKNSTTTVLANKTVQNVDKCFLYELSANREYLLLAYHYRKIFRYSFIAHYDVIHLKTGFQFTLDNDNGAPRDIQLAKWSPVGHSLATVENYNIIFTKDITNPSDRVQLTLTGDSNLYYGIPDWVYEEEIFSSNSAMWFSKRGNSLAYAEFNDSLVPIMPIPWYGVSSNSKYQYPSTTQIHYPKVGVRNPIVQLYVQQLNETSNGNSKPILVEPPKTMNSFRRDYILNTVIWSNDTTLFVMWMNRVQNQSSLVQYSVSANVVQIERVIEFSQPGGWLDFTQLPLVGVDNDLAIIYPMNQSNGDHYKHIVIVERNSSLTAVTSGKFEVIELLKWDILSNYIYYLANTEGNPEEQYLYRTIAKPLSTPECLSCKMDCKFHKAEMSMGNNYYTHICSGPNVPEIRIHNMTGDKVLDWDLNAELKETLDSVPLPQVFFIDVPISADFKARVKIILPPAVDENMDIKHPLLVNTYAGPGSNLALNKFSLDWNTYFSSSENVIVAQIDGRGTGRRGDKNLFANYKKLGTYEIEDQLFVARYLLDKYSYIDKSKTAIWGWSYGGYATGMALAKDTNNVFKCGLSVAPVTDWMFYDTIYTERYMGLYSENSENYKNSSLLKHAEKIGNNKYMIMHGTYDDNVHYQQSMMLAYELERKVILFRQQSYPDESHGLSSYRNHVYQTIGSYFSECFRNKM